MMTKLWDGSGRGWRAGFGECIQGEEPLDKVLGPRPPHLLCNLLLEHFSSPGLPSNPVPVL